MILSEMEGSVFNTIERTTKRAGLVLNHGNTDEFEALWNEIMVNHEYSGVALGVNPVIIDAGANLGLATIYFANTYPNAQIIAIEPSPISFPRLEKNVAVNHIKGVTLINAALSSVVGETELYIDLTNDDPWTWGDSGVERMYGGEPTAVKVVAITLSSVIEGLGDKFVDLLKIDIEGTELEVLKESENALIRVRNLFLEYHSSPANPENAFDEVMNIIIRSGFTVTCFKDGKIIQADQIKDLKKEESWNIVIKGFRSGGVI